ncbi:MAG: class I SAM-dependent methyltransferase [Anaerolineae bacterium]|jgi:ubiquinone/menaquinone biosynthesis C-methylase UbiE
MDRKQRFLLALEIVLISISGLLLFWLVLIKIIYRLLERLGVDVPGPSRVSWLMDNPIRRRYVHPVLDRVGVRPGETVLELGPGPAPLTIEAARRVGPKGKLIVVQEDPRMAADVEQQVHEAGLDNVEVHAASADDLPVPDESVDRVFLVAVLPEVPHQHGALDELRRVLKSGGLLSITEEFTDPDYAFPFETVQLVEEMGFSRERYYGNFWVYTLNFGKSEGIAFD